MQNRPQQNPQVFIVNEEDAEHRKPELPNILPNSVVSQEYIHQQS